MIRTTESVAQSSKSHTPRLIAWAAPLWGRWRNRYRRLGIRPAGVSRVLIALLLGSGSLPSDVYALDPNALPTGGKVVAGTASISQAGNALTVTQSTPKLIADWTTFNIGSDASVTFAQPGADSVALNRVISADPSLVYGRLSANGQVFLLNPNGVIFGKGAQVDVGGLVATSLAMTNEDFLAGRYTFTAGGIAGAVRNEGVIVAANGGYVAMIAPQVSNTGTITANGGTVAMAAGSRVSLDFGGDGLLKVSVDGDALGALVENKGVLRSQGGLVQLAAHEAGNLAATVINQTGLIEATAITERGGRIFLDGGEHGVVTVGGKLDASAKMSDGIGGNIAVIGDKIGLIQAALLDASGASGGGSVLVGGEMHGAGTLRRASAVIMDPTAKIDVDATVKGNGGTAVLWSDQYTDFRGSITARGGVQGGDGGQVETSSKNNLQAFGNVDASAPLGAGGNWLLDPTDITITSFTSGGTYNTGPPGSFTPSGASANVNAASINTSLNGGTSVTISTASAFGGSGDIIVGSAISKTAGGDATLTLQATRNISVNTSIGSTTGKLNIVLNSNTGLGGGYVDVGVTGSLTSNGGDITIGGGANPLTTAATGQGLHIVGVTLSGPVNAGGGNISIQGASSATITVGGGVQVQSAVSTNGAGTITIVGTSVGSTLASTDGVFVQAGGTVTAVNGQISITGTSNSTGTGSGNDGVSITGLGSSVSTTGTGNIVITGTGGGSGIGGSNFGVVWDVANAINASGGGSVTITGTGGNSAGSGNYGISPGSALAVTGAGNITMTGTGGGTGILERGYANFGFAVTAAGGNISITGNASPTSTVGGDDGVYLSGAGTAVSTTGAGTITIAGTARGTGVGNGTYGVMVTTGATVSGVNGLVSVTGTSNSTAVGTDNTGVYITGTGSAVRTTGTGTVSVTGTGGGTGGGGLDFGVRWDVANGISATGGGNIVVTGTGGDAGGSGGTNYGVVTNQTLSASGTGSITITGTGGNSSGASNIGFIQGAAITTAGGNITINATGGGTGNTERGYSNSGFAVTAAGGNISITGAAAANATGSNDDGVFLSGAGSAITTTGAGTITIAGTADGSGTGASTYGVLVTTGATVSAVNGAVSVTGTNSSTGTGVDNSGVYITGTGSFVRTSGTGAVSVTGTGGGGGAGGTDYGVHWDVANGISATGGGNISVIGTGGNSGGSGATNYGVFTNQAITASGTGAISITGTGGNSSGASNIGFIQGAAVTTAGGNITINATGGGTGNTERGYSNPGFAVTAAGGNISITGNASTNATLSNDDGVFLSGAGSAITTTGTGTITIAGTARGTSTGASTYGVLVTTGATVSAVNGAVSVTGTNNSTGTGVDNSGVFITGTGSFVRTTGTGAVSVTGTGGGAGAGGTDYGVSWNVASGISATGGGNISVTGTGGNNGGSGATNYGVFTNQAITTSGAGTISVTGTGGNSSGASNIGFIQSAAVTTAGGNITINGTGGGSGNTERGYSNTGAAVTAAGGNISITGNASTTSTGSNDDGVFLTGAGSAISTTGTGTITIAGTARGTSTGASTYGVLVTTGATITAANGNVGVTGTNNSTGTGVDNSGVFVTGTGSSIKTTGTGNVAVTGTGGGTGAGGTDYGVSWNIANGINATGTGTITINGTGGDASGSGTQNHGVNAAAALSTAGGALSITGTGGNSSGATNYGINVTGALSSTGGNITLNGTGGGTGTGEVGVSITPSITAAGGSISITGIASATATGSGDHGVVIAGGGTTSTTGTGTITIAGTATGNGAGASTYGVLINTASIVSAANGNVAITGTNNSTGTGADNSGVYITAASSSVKTTGTGNINVTGTGGGTGAGGSDYGVHWDVASGISATGGGSIAVTGTGGDAGGSGATNYGVFTNQAITTSGAGTISVTGTGGNSSGASNIGFIQSAALTTAGANIAINATGGGTGNTERGYVSTSAVTAAGGNISITGTASANATGSSNDGVNISTASAAITTTGTGTLTIAGTATGTAAGAGSSGVNIGGSATATTVNGLISVTGTNNSSGTGGTNAGVSLAAAAQVASSGTGAVTVTGAGGTGTGTTNAGISNTGTISAVSGTLTVNGTARVAGSFGVSNTGLIRSTGSSAINITAQRTGTSADAFSSSGLIGGATASGDVTINSDADTFTTAGVTTSGNINIVPLNPGTSVGVGTGAGTLSLSDTELALLSWGSTKYLSVGLANAAAITINSNHTFPNPVLMQNASGNDITVTGTLRSTASSAPNNNAIVLASGRNFFGGNINVTGGGRYLTYSFAPSQNIESSLTGSLTRVYDSTITSYPPASVTQTGNTMIYLAHAPGTITITAVDKSKVYGDAVPTLTYTFACSPSCTEAAALLTGPSLSTTATSASNAGTYAITPAGATLSNLFVESTINYVPGTLTVTPAPLTITGTVTVANKVYNANTAASVSGGAISGLVNGDTLTLVPGGNFVSKNVGTGVIVNATYAVTGAAAGNYTITQPTGLSANITPASLTAGLTGTVSKVYDSTSTATLTAGNYTLTGVLGTDVVTTNAPASGTYDTVHVGTGKTVTVSGVSLTGLDAGNYTLTSSTLTGGVGTITTRGITVTADAKTRVYGDANPALTYAVGGAGLAGSDTLTGSLATTATVTSNVGNYGITQGTVAASADYSLTYTTANLTVTARPITITSSTGQTKVYGADDSGAAATAYSITGGNLVNSNTLTGSMGRAVGESVGSYDFTQGTATVSDGNGGNNYAITFNGSTNPYVITAAPLTATIANQSKVYGANDPALAGITPVLSGVINRTVHDINGNNTVINNTGNVAGTVTALTRNAGENVGAYNVTAATLGALTGSAAGNYSAPTFTGTATLTITAAPLSATIANQSKVYGADDPLLTSITPALSGLINRTVTTWNGNVAVDDTGNLATTLASLARTTGENVGTRNITAATFGALTGSAAGNYSAPTFSGTPTLTITAAPLGATIANQTKVYGADDPTLSGISPTLTGVINRTVSTWNGSVAVNDTGSVADTLASLTRAAGENVGVRNITAATFGTLTGSAAGNYSGPTLSGTPTLTITQAPLTASIANQSKVYGADDPLLSSITPSLGGVINRTVATWNGSVAVNDTAAVADTLASLTRAAGENVGVLNITAATFGALTGSAAGNYSGPTFTGSPTLTIAAAPLTATIANQTKVYGADDPLLSGIAPTLTGVINRTVSTWNGGVAVNDTGNVVDTLASVSRQAGENVGTRNITAATFGSLTGSAAGNYSAPTFTGSPILTITAAPLSATIANQSKVYGADDPTLSGITPTLTGVINRTVSTWNGGVAINDTGNVVDSVSSLTRVAGENVGAYNVTAATLGALTGSAASNYSAPTFTGTPTLTITSAPLNAALANQTKVYGADDPLVSSIVITLSPINRTVSTWNGNVLVDDTGNVSATVASLTRNAGENVGSHAITGGSLAGLSGSASGNYSASLTVSGSAVLTITAAPLTASLANQSKIYGADDPSLSGVVPTLNGVINRTVSTWNGNVTVNDTGNVADTLASLTRVAGENVGTRNITAATFGALTGSAAGNYSAPTLTGTPTLTITAAPLTATVINQTKVYGADDPLLSSITPSLGGVVNRSVSTWNGSVAVNDTAAVAGTLASLTRATGENVGTRNITAATFNPLTGASAGNYSGPTFTGTPILTITAAPLSASIAPGSQTKVYGADDPLLSAITPALSGVINRTVTTWNGGVAVNDTSNVDTSVATLTRAAGESVGTHAITGGTLSALTGSAAGNYTASLDVSGSPALTITPASLTATIANQGKVYGNDDPLLSTITPGLTGLINRTVSTWNGNVAVNDTAAVADTLASLTRATGENVGAYNITAATFNALTGSSAGNYNAPTFTGTPTLTITAAPLAATLTVPGQTKVYGADDPLLSGIGITLAPVNRTVATWNGNVAVDDTGNVAASLTSLTRNAGENVGTHAITGGSLTALSGSAAGNYTGSLSVTGSPVLTITPASLTASISNQTKLYGADDPALAGITPTLSGVVNRSVSTWNGAVTVNDTAAVADTLASLTRASGENVGSYIITAATFNPLTGASAGNYNLPTFTGVPTLTVTAAPLSGILTVPNQTKVYGTDDPSLPGIGITLAAINRTVSTWNGNVVVNDTGNVSATVASLSRTAGENVGSYSITGGSLSALSGSAAGNYSATLILGGSPTLQITPASLTATLAAGSLNKVYGADDPALAGIAPTLAGLVNRTVTTWNGGVAINDTGNVNAPVASLTRAAGENVGTHAITGGSLSALTGGAAGNYTATLDVTGTPVLTITAAPLGATIANQTKVYGADDPLLSGITPTLTGVVNRTVSTWNGNVAVNDTGNVSNSLASLTRLAGENVGSYNVTAATFDPLSGSAAGNYTGPTFTGTPTLTITKATLTGTITVGSLTKVYGTDDPALAGITPTLTGIVNRSVATWNGSVAIDDTGNVATSVAALTRTAGENVGTRAITGGTLSTPTGSAAGNYTASLDVSGSPVLTITAAPLTATIANQSKVYGADDPALAGITPTLTGVVNRTVSTWNGNVAVNDTAAVADTLATLTRVAGENVGTRNITAATFNPLSGASSGNYSAPTFTGTPTLTITPAAAVASIAVGSQTKVYGADDPVLSGIVPTLSGVINRSVATWNGSVAVNDVGSVSASVSALTRAAGENVGTHAITGGTLSALTGGAAGNYTASLSLSGSPVLTITAAPLTATIANQAKVYGADDPLLSGIAPTLTGVINRTVSTWNGNVAINDTTAVADTLLTLTRVAGENVGTRNITAATFNPLTGASAGNYSAPTFTGTPTLTITAAPLSATLAVPSQVKVYGTDDPAISGIAITLAPVNRTVSTWGGNVVVNDTGNVLATLTSLTRAAGENVGGHAITGGALSALTGSAAGNYSASLAFSGSPTLIITAAPLTATIANQSKVYGADDPLLSGIVPTLTGIVNRTVSSWNGNVTVNDTGLVAAPLASLTRVAGENVGTRNITGATFGALTGTAAGNYLAPTFTGTPTLTITRGTLAASIGSQSKVYGADDPSLAGITPTLIGVVNRTVSTWNGGVAVNDTGSVADTLATLTRAAGENVGSYNITAATFGALTGSSAGNYNTPIFTGSPILTITAAPLSATIANQTKVYGNDDPLLASITPTLTGIINRTVTTWNGNVAVNDTSNVGATLATLSRIAGENVGTRNITSATFGLTGTSAGNYSAPTYTGTHTLNITAAPLTATVANQTKVYGADDPLLSGITPSLIGVVNRTVTTWNGNVAVNDTAALGDTVTSLTRVAGETVGTRNITGATFGALTGSASGNYSAPTFTGTPILTITPAALTASIAPGSQTKVYGADDPVLSGIVPTITGVINRTVSTWNGGIAINDTGSVSASVTTLSRAAGENVGTHAITGGTLSALSGSAAGNYTASLSVSGSPVLTITAAPLTASIANQAKVYGVDDPLLASIAPTLNGLINRTVSTWNGAVAVNDTSSVAGTLAALTRVAGENVGTRNITAATFNPLTGSSAGNYSAPTFTGTPTLTITPAAIGATMTVPGQTKVYGADDPLLAGIGITLAPVNRTVSTWNGGVAVNDTGSVNASVTALTRNVGENVGSYAITGGSLSALTGSAAGNYSASLTFSGTPTLTITAAPLGASIANETKVYGNADPLASSITPTLTGIINRPAVATWNGSVAINDAGNVTDAAMSVTRAPGENVGIYSITNVTFAAPGGSAGGNYSAAAFTGSPTLTITSRPITISAQTDTRVYDATTTSSVTPTLTSGSLAFSDTLTGLTQTFDVKNAGARTLSVGSGYTLNDGNGGNNYAVTLQTAAGTITQKPLTSVIVVNNKVYDATTAATGTVGPLIGVVAGDTATLSGSPTLAFADKNAGAGKSVTASGFTLTGADAANYAVTIPTGLSATITAKALSVTGVAANDKVYDGTTTATLTGGALSGVIAGDTVTLTAGTGSFADKNVGTAKPVTATGYALGGTDSGNYTITNPVGLTASITPATLGLTVTGVTANDKVYDGTLTATLNTSGSVLTGVMGGDVVTLNSSAAAGQFLTKDVGTGKTVVVTGYTISGADAANYQFTQPVGLTASITVKALPIIGVVAQDKVFDATTVATLNNAGTHLTGVVGGDDVTLSVAGSSGSFADANAGTGKAVTAIGYTISGTDAGNYALIQPTGLAANITPAPVSTTGTSVIGTIANNKVYDGTTAATLNTGSSTIAGLLPGATNVTLVTSAAVGTFDTKDVGTGKTVTISGFTLTGSDAGNYQLSPTSTVTANITAKPLTITGVVGVDRVYDGSTTAGLATGSASVPGVITGDAVTLGGSPAGSFADKNVGIAKAVTVTGFTISGADAGNYTLVQPTGVVASVTAATIAVTGVTAQNRTYDGTTVVNLNPGTVAGIVGGDSVTLAPGIGSMANKNVGTGKAVTVSGYTLSGADAGNYQVTTPSSLTVNITPATITVTAATDSKPFDGTTASTALPIVVGLAPGDTITATQVFDDPGIGTGKTLIPSATINDGNGGANYTLALAATAGGAITVPVSTPPATPGAPAPDLTCGGVWFCSGVRDRLDDIYDNDADDRFDFDFAYRDVELHMQTDGDPLYYDTSGNDLLRFKKTGLGDAVFLTPGDSDYGEPILREEPSNQDGGPVPPRIFIKAGPITSKPNSPPLTRTGR